MQSFSNWLIINTIHTKQHSLDPPQSNYSNKPITQCINSSHIPHSVHTCPYTITKLQLHINKAHIATSLTRSRTHPHQNQHAQFTWASQSRLPVAPGHQLSNRIPRGPRDEPHRLALPTACHTSILKPCLQTLHPSLDISICGIFQGPPFLPRQDHTTMVAFLRNP